MIIHLFHKKCLCNRLNQSFRTLEPISNYYVRAGSNSPQKGGSLHRLTKMYAYNDTAYLYWLSSMLYHDIALFKVRPRFHFTDSVRAIRLPSEFSKAPRTLYTCGWGYRSLRNNVSTLGFKPAQMQSVSQNQARNDFLRKRKSKTCNKICLFKTSLFRKLIFKIS